MTSQRSLVGRRLPQLLLDRWLAEVRDGEARLVVVDGEAGVGKTRLVTEWVDRAGRDGARVLIGRAYEDASTPFLALAGALTDLPAAVDALSSPATDVEGDRSALARILCITRSLIDAAAHRPTVLVIDDVHWSDQSTLDFLAHIVTTASLHATTPRLALMVVVTVRATDGSSRAQSMLNHLRAEPISRALHLQGLDQIETGEVVRQRLERPPTPRFLDEVCRVTAGNPLLIELLLDELERRSLLKIGTHVSAEIPADLTVVSPGLEEAWQARLDKVGPATSSLLVHGALLGDGGSIDLLCCAADLGEGAVDELLAEAGDAGLLDLESSTYHFRHPLLRSALLQRLTPRRRTAMQRTTTERLVAHRQLTGWPPDLAIADQARTAGLLSVLPDVVLRRAGDDAVGLGGWAFAADCYEELLRRVPATASADERAKVHLWAGRAHRYNTDFRSAHPHLLRAVALAADAGDTETWGEALAWVTSAQVLERVDEVLIDRSVVDRFLDHVGDKCPDAQAQILGNVAQYHFARFDVTSAGPSLARAKELARGAHRVGTRYFVAMVEGFNRMGALELRDAERCFREAVGLSGAHEDQWEAVFIKVCLPIVDLLAGNLVETEQEASAAIQDAIEASQWHLHGLAEACLAAAAVGQGRVVDGERHGVASLESFRRSDYFWAAAVGVPQLAAARALRGDVHGAREVLADWVEGGELAARAAMRTEALCGDEGRLRALVAEHPFGPLPSTASVFTLGQACTAVEVGDRLGDQDLLAAGFEHLAAVPDGVVFSIEWCSCLARVAAEGAVALGRFDEAEQLLRRAADAAERARSPLERARAHVLRARLLVAAGDEAAILDELEPALAFAEQTRLVAITREAVRMVPDLTRRRQREMVILYTDLVSSTELNVTAGDELFLELLREHNRIVRRRLSTYGGVEFTHTGDGIGAHFASADRATEFALGLQADFDAANAAHPELPLRVRVGLAMGPALEDDGNLFGQTVVRAVRVCATAAAGQVLAAEEVAATLDPAIARSTSIGKVGLKGFPGTAALYEPRRASAADYATTS